MKVGMLTASVSPFGGGVPEVARSLALAIHDPPECEIEVFGLDDGHDADLAKWQDVPVSVLNVKGPSSFGYAPDLGPRLAARTPDLLHVHGIWMYPSIAALRWNNRARAPYIVSPHGMLDPWALAHSRLKKRVAHLLFERMHLRRAACLHALCEPEARALRDFGLTNPICVIPNGVAIPDDTRAEPPVWRSRLPADAKILLYLGRLHVKKGLSPLLEALAECARDKTRYQNWHLVIAGWDQLGHRAELEAAASSLGLPGVHFVGPQFQSDKEATYRACDAFILPSLSEGVPMTVLEAWAHGLPVLMTDHCNLPQGFEERAALRIEPSREGIAAGLRVLFTLEGGQRRTIGAKGRALAARRFSWPAVAAQMREVYRWLVEGGEVPTCVRTV